jgi:hypothetical protein
MNASDPKTQADDPPTQLSNRAPNNQTAGLQWAAHNITQEYPTLHGLAGLVNKKHIHSSGTMKVATNSLHIKMQMEACVLAQVEACVLAQRPSTDQKTGLLMYKGGAPSTNKQTHGICTEVALTHVWASRDVGHGRKQ